MGYIAIATTVLLIWEYVVTMPTYSIWPLGIGVSARQGQLLQKAAKQIRRIEPDRKLNLVAFLPSIINVTLTRAMRISCGSYGVQAAGQEKYQFATRRSNLIGESACLGLLNTSEKRRSLSKNVSATPAERSLSISSRQAGRRGQHRNQTIDRTRVTLCDLIRAMPRR